MNIDFDWFLRKGGTVFYRCMDVTLNGLNSAAHTIFINGATRGIIEFFKDAPARVAVFVMVPVWASSGISQDALKNRRDELYNKVRLGTFPKGLTAFFAVIILALLFLFSFRGAIQG